MDEFSAICSRIALVECFMSGMELGQLSRQAKMTPEEIKIQIREYFLWQAGNRDLSLMPWANCVMRRDKAIESEVQRLTLQPEFFMEEYVPEIVLQKISA